MTLHSLSPGYIKLHYDTVVSAISMSHVMVLPVNLETPGDGAASQVGGRVTVNIPWRTYVDTFVGLIKTQWSNACTFTGAEIFSQLDADSEPFFEDVYPLAVVGTNAAGLVTASQTVMTFKTFENGLLKLTMIETSNAINLRQVYSAMTAAQKAIVDHIIGTASGVWGRDNAFASLSLHLTTKTNDKVRKHRFNL